MQSSPTGDEYTASIPSGEGDIPTFITKPEGDGPFPCVIFYMDIFGPREELYQMCRRFASKGYLTVLPHLFYRDGSFTCHPTQRSESEMQRALELNVATTNKMVASDTESIIDFLDIEESADAARVGTIGTCMGARHAVIAAAMYPENIHAYSALHGGRMVTELDDSPHLFLNKLKCEGYIGWASNDVDQNPEHLELYRESFAKRGAENQIEVFKSALHGYFFPERPQYNKDAAETAWTKTLALFSDALTI